MKAALHDHISRLLFDHECVVVPGFGAFLTRFYSAEVNTATHMLRPPSRRVYFNKSIKENDGLLAKSISLNEKCSYDQALDFIKAEVKSWKRQLSGGKKLRLTGIGRLYIDESSNLQFSPSLENNYQRSSYGLAIFRSPAIHRETAIRKGIQKTIERHIVAEPKKEKTEKKRKAIPWAAVLGPVIFAGIIGAGYLAYQNDHFGNISGLNWFEHSRSIEESTTEKADENLTSKPDSEITEETENLDKPEPATAEKEKATPVSEEAKEEIPVAQIYPYHIIVGSFKDQANAQGYISKLQANGYEAYMANGNPQFHRVAIGNFATKDQARQALQGIRQNLQSGAWIYSN